MPVSIRAITRAQDADDVSVSLGAGVDGYALTYDDGTGKFVLTDLSGIALTVDTRENILASTPSSVSLAFMSDTSEFALWDGSSWQIAPLELNSQANTVDVGLLPPMVFNDRSGYNADGFTDKSIYNSRVLGSVVEESGSIRTSDEIFQIYLDGEWRDITTGISFREDSDTYELETKPFGFTWWLEAFSGNSDLLGLNGLPLVQQYQVSMGAYPVHQQIQGRSITA